LLHMVLTLRTGKDGVTETVVDFYAKVYDKKKFEELYWDQWKKDPAEEWINNLLLKEPLPIDIGESKDKDKKGGKDFLSLMAKRVDEMIDKFQGMVKKIKLPGQGKGLRAYDINQLIGAASGEVKKDLGLIYFVVKKSFGMVAELDMFM